jgi:hypothetical protein
MQAINRCSTTEDRNHIKIWRYGNQKKKMKSTWDKGEAHSLEHKHQKNERFVQRRKLSLKTVKKYGWGANKI